VAVDTEQYYRTYGPMVLRRCRRLLGDEERARDAMHDVFVRLLLSQERLDDRAPSSLLYRIATNVCLNKIRREKRRPSDPDSELIARIASSSDDGNRLSARSLLRQLFGNHPISSAEMAVMHLVDGMTLEQVAEECEMSVSGVRKRLRKLRTSISELKGIGNV